MMRRSTRIRSGVCMLSLTLFLLAGRPSAQYGGVEVLHRFAWGTTPAAPTSIVALPDGSALVVGGSGNSPTSIRPLIARVTADGTSTALRSFPDAPFDRGSAFRLTRSGSGRLYGVSQYGGSRGFGTIFSIGADGGYSLVYAFEGGGDGMHPEDLVAGSDGVLYGQLLGNDFPYLIDTEGALRRSSFPMLGRLAAVGPDGSAYVLNGFWCSGPPCALVRYAASGGFALVAGPFPDLEFKAVVPQADGTILALVAHPSLPSRCDVLRITSGVATTTKVFGESCGDRYSLQSDPTTEGAYGFTAHHLFTVSADGTVTVVAQAPDMGSLTPAILDVDRGVDGALWGVSTGGALENGTVFRVPPTGGWTTVLTSPRGNVEGIAPAGLLVPDGDGFLYGAARYGGRFNSGTLFRASKVGGRFEVLYPFTGGSDGRSPNALVRAPDGALYGTTPSGDGHDGTIFRVSRSGALTTLFVFRRPQDGRYPGDLVVGADGALYGRAAGSEQGVGSIAFRFSPNDGFSVLHRFPSTGVAASFNTSRLLAAGDGNLYGLTQSRVIRLTARGDLTSIWTPPNQSAVLLPPLLQSSDGNLMGEYYDYTEGAGGVFMTSTTGFGQLIRTNRTARLETVAGGSVFGLAAEALDSDGTGITVVKVLPTGEVRRHAPSGPLRYPAGVHPNGFDGSLTDGGDGFLYGTVYAGSDDLGQVFRVPGAGPTAPGNFRVVR